MSDREKVIGLLQEMAEYFRECRNNASFASKAENHFLELQNAANEAVKLLKEHETTLNRLRSTMEDMVRGNASEEVSYLLRLMGKWEKGA